MMVWRGWGIVVVGVAFVALVIAVAISGALNLDDDQQLVAAGIVFLPSAVALWFIGKRMNANARRILVDPATGAEVRVDRTHDFFFVPVQWWGPIGFVLGIVVIVSGIAGRGAPA